MAEVGGFECEFVNEPPSVIQSSCPVCLLVLREPSQVTCCGKSYCRSCIEIVKARNNPCPCCQQKNFVDYPNKGLQQPLYGLHVYCTYKKEGCEWTGELRALDKHHNLEPEQEKELEGCLFAKIKCNHCSKTIQRKQLGPHQNELCSKRPFSCEYCDNYKSTFEDVISNHWLVCDCYPIQCPNKCGVTSERKNLDSHLKNHCPLEIVQCDFYYAGCETKLPRQDMPSHVSDSLITHVSMLAISHRSQLSKNQALVQEMEQLKQTVATLKQKVVMLTQDNVALKTEVDGLRKGITKSDSSVQWLCSHVGLFPKEFIIEDYKNHTLGWNVWYSPPFYSHLHGYKLCLEVKQCLQSIAIKACLMRGEFDDHLQWPFMADIPVSLQNQRESRICYRKCIKFSGGPESERVCFQKRNSFSCGIANFMSIEQLEFKYIKNSCLHITVSNVFLVGKCTKKSQS